MTPEEFDFWQRAYLAAITGLPSDAENYNAYNYTIIADQIANLSITQYRTAKATVVQTTYSTGD